MWAALAIRSKFKRSFYLSFHWMLKEFGGKKTVIKTHFNYWYSFFEMWLSEPFFPISSIDVQNSWNIHVLRNDHWAQWELVQSTSIEIEVLKSYSKIRSHCSLCNPQFPKSFTQLARWWITKNSIENIKSFNYTFFSPATVFYCRVQKKMVLSCAELFKVTTSRGNHDDFDLWRRTNCIAIELE